jgi:hypothetical protein
MNEQRPTNPPAIPQQPQIRPLGAGATIPQQPRAVIPPAPTRPTIATPPNVKPPVVDDTPISLVEEAPVEQVSTATPKKIVAFGVAAAHHDRDYKRKPHADGKGACRVKTFHAKYSEQGLEHLDDMVNDWLEAHPEVEVKFCNTTVHVFEGKIREPALVLNMWY